jgi:hypothetical protein
MQDQINRARTATFSVSAVLFSSRPFHSETKSSSGTRLWLSYSSLVGPVGLLSLSAGHDILTKRFVRRQSYAGRRTGSRVLRNFLQMGTGKKMVRRGTSLSGPSGRQDSAVRRPCDHRPGSGDMASAFAPPGYTSFPDEESIRTRWVLSMNN